MFLYPASYSYLKVKIETTKNRFHQPKYFEMYLKIREANAISLNVAKGSSQIEINITTVIEYYGITELFDTIGEDELRSYLDLLNYDLMKEIREKRNKLRYFAVSSVMIDTTDTE